MATRRGLRGGGPGWCGVPGQRGLGLKARGHRGIISAQVLDLAHNELSFVPPDLPEALEELHLQGNRISHVGPEAFLSTPRLRALFLRCPRGGWGERVLGAGGPEGL